MRHFFPAFTLLIVACASVQTPPATVADLPDIDTAAVLRHIEVLAADEFAGRAPGSRGEELTVDYLVGQFQQIGLAPGNPDGTFIQQVPLVGITPSGFSPLTVRRGGETRAFAYKTDYVGISLRVTEEISRRPGGLRWMGVRGPGGARSVRRCTVAGSRR